MEEFILFVTYFIHFVIETFSLWRLQLFYLTMQIQLGKDSERFAFINLFPLIAILSRWELTTEVPQHNRLKPIPTHLTVARIKELNMRACCKVLIFSAIISTKLTRISKELQPNDWIFVQLTFILGAITWAYSDSDELPQPVISPNRKSLQTLPNPCLNHYSLSNNSIDDRWATNSARNSTIGSALWPGVNHDETVNQAGKGGLAGN